jgi:hypothetical protein
MLHICYICYNRGTSVHVHRIVLQMSVVVSMGWHVQLSKQEHYMHCQ